ncbi:hypothetical protein STEG23_031663, partial [Scotinomys teguina]
MLVILRLRDTDLWLQLIESVTSKVCDAKYLPKNFTDFSWQLSFLEPSLSD